MFDWVVATISDWGYLGVFVLMVAENLFPPIPSEVIMPLAGFLAGSGRLSLTLTIVIGTLGSVIGTTVWYYIGMAFGEERLKRFAARHGRWLTRERSIWRLPLSSERWVGSLRAPTVVPTQCSQPLKPILRGRLAPMCWDSSQFTMSPPRFY